MTGSWTSTDKDYSPLLTLHRTAKRPGHEVSGYVQELTRYLSNIMNTTLLGLPPEIKGFIYFDALNHAANLILVRATT